MITVGVAGHIDHGKSSVVKRLTGVDPDRLPEEKARGMTIDLGFAHWKLPGGADDDVISFVDVPGHERFVRNMIAGAGGISAIALVVAADDGWMPQSQEHFDIVRLLNVNSGIIIVTKADLVEPEWLAEVIDDIRAKVRGTFLESAEIVAVSSTTGQGYENLEKALANLARANQRSQDTGRPRLFADRSFDMPGMGKVVTGTLRGGTFSEGDEIIVYPDMAKGRIRAIQRHGEPVSRVTTGQRTALAFTGIDRDILSRGKVITTPELAGGAGDRRFLIVELETLADCPVKMSHRRELLYFLGASEIRCELRLPGGAVTAPGESAVCVLRCESEPFCFVGDHFVVRLPTPQVTVGGGTVLSWCDTSPSQDVLRSITHYWKMDIPVIERAVCLDLQSEQFGSAKTLLRRSEFSPDSVEKALMRLNERGVVAQFAGKWYLKNETDSAITGLMAKVESIFAGEPHHKGLLPGELHRLIPRDYRTADKQALIDLVTQSGRLVHTGGRYKPAGTKQTVTGAVKREADRIQKELQDNPFTPPLIPALVKPGKDAREALGFLFDSGAAVKVTSELALDKSAWISTLKTIATALDNNEELTVAYLRTKLNTSRKYALPILEATDRLGYTTRDGDVRKPGRKIDDMKALLKSASPESATQ